MDGENLYLYTITMVVITDHEDGKYETSQVTQIHSEHVLKMLTKTTQTDK